jgi:2'-5' RNA ligase
VSRRRLFFALWPDDETRRALAEAARPLLEACRGRPVPANNYHLTLNFLGGVETAGLEAIRVAAAGLRATPFELKVDCHGHWPKPGVAWLGCRQTPPAAGALARTLDAALEPLGFKPDPRPFRPHLTVLRDCRRCDWDGSPVTVGWRVEDFALVKSETLESGPRYELLERWPLAGLQSAPNDWK